MPFFFVQCEDAQGRTWLHDSQSYLYEYRESSGSKRKAASIFKGRNDGGTRGVACMVGGEESDDRHPKMLLCFLSRYRHFLSLNLKQNRFSEIQHIKPTPCLPHFRYDADWESYFLNFFHIFLLKNAGMHKAV